MTALKCQESWKKILNSKIALLLSVNNAKFRRPVVPVDVLILQAIGIQISGKGGRIQAKALVGEQLVAEAEIRFVLIEREQLETGNKN